MKANPYPKTITDESSGVVVSNNEYYIWEDGFKAGKQEGIKEVVETILAIIENPKQAHYRLKEITEYCESRLDTTTSDVIQ